MIFHYRLRLLAAPAIALLPLAGFASGQVVTSIPPFVGTLTESFESSATGASNCITGPWVTTCAEAGVPALFVTSTLSSPSCNLGPFDGASFGSAIGPGLPGTGTETVLFRLANPLNRFGLWVARGDNDALPITVTVISESGAEIDRQVLTIPSCDWQWIGRESSGERISRVEIERATLSPLPLLFDGLNGDGGGATIGAIYCSPAAANSTGSSAVITAEGSLDAAANDVTLRATGLPAFSFGLFITSQVQDVVPNPAGSAGTLCLGGAVGRFVAPGQVLSSGAGGVIELPIDLTTLPTPTGLVAAAAGETWNFQTWYRDANPTITSNFTSGVSLVFE